MTVVLIVLGIVCLVALIYGISHLDQRFGKRENKKPRPPRPRYKDDGK